MHGGRTGTDSKLPLFLVAMCYAVLRMEAPGITEAAQMAALLLLLCLYAAFGHIVNDYADRDADRTAGKKKLLAQWSEPAALTAVALPPSARWPWLGPASISTRLR